MSSGSNASNLGYGNITPFSNINGKYVNVHNTNYPGNFSSNEIPGTPPGPIPGLSGIKNNVIATSASKILNGGKRVCSSENIKRKIKNITKHYKRMKTKRRINSLKRKISKSYKLKHSKSKRRHRNRKRQRGGYSQYQNNMPNTPSYQVAGINLPSSQLGLANPPPITRLNNCVNCVDNYNHYTNKGFSSKGN